MKRIVFLVLAGLAVWFAFSKFSGGDAPKAVGASAVKVSVAVAARKDVPISLALVGNVIAYESVAIKSRVDSQITEVKFKDGDYVEKGQVLFKLDDRAIKAQMAEEQAKTSNAKLQYERARKLMAGKYVSQENVDNARANYETELAALENAKVLLNYTTITAPISGRAGTINTTTGNNVKANDANPLVTINQVKPIRAQFAIPERYYEQVRAAMIAGEMPVIATRQGVAGETSGKLEYIDNAIDQTTGSFIARANFANEAEALWPGMFVNLALDLGVEKSALAIPAVAIQGDEDKHFVFKVIDGKAIKTVVNARIIGDEAIISKGISDGETIITDGLLRVSDGASVALPTTEK